MFSCGSGSAAAATLATVVTAAATATATLAGVRPLQQQGGSRNYSVQLYNIIECSFVNNIYHYYHILCY
jgi:hypothetical protein